MPLTIHGKKLVAVAMYQRGKAFIAASILLRQNGGYHYVVLHLMCQGLEIILKAFLMVSDPNKYSPKYLKKKFGHNLMNLVTETLSIYGLRELRPPLRSELERLNALYANHILRYADFRDVLQIHPGDYGLIFVRMSASIHLAERQLKRLAQV